MTLSHDEAGEINQAPVRPCAECPWLNSNQGRPVPDKEFYDGVYARPLRAELWALIRTGPAKGICHMSDIKNPVNPLGADPDWIAMGYHEVPSHAQARECGGGVAAALRELRRIVEVGSWEEYERHRPGGMTREAAAFWARRLQGEQPGFPPVRVMNVADSEIIDPAAEDDLHGLDRLTPGQMSTLASIFSEIRGSLPDPQAAP